MAARDLRFLLAADDDRPITLDQEQRREILRRLERLDRIEIEHEELRRENRELREKLQDQAREIERLKRHTAELDVAIPPSKKLHRPAAPAEARARGRTAGPRSARPRSP